MTATRRDAEAAGPSAGKRTLVDASLAARAAPAPDHEATGEDGADEGEAEGAHRVSGRHGSLPRLQLGSPRAVGDHAPAAPAATPAAAAPAAAAPAKPTGPLKITSKTVFERGAATRTVLGVGEELELTGSEAGEWTATGGTPTTGSGTADSFTWKAPAKPGSYVIKLKVDKKVTSKAVVVIAPSSIKFTVAGPMDFGAQGAGASLMMELGPKTVSFGNVVVKEKAGPATGVWGYFKKKSGLDHNPQASWTTVSPDNFLDREDEAYFSDWPEPWSPGGMTWVVPHLYALAGEEGEGTVFTSVSQTMTIADKKGTSVMSKGGATVRRAP